MDFGICRGLYTRFFYRKSLFQPALNFLIFCLFQPQNFLKFCPGPGSDFFFFLSNESQISHKNLFRIICTYMCNYLNKNWSVLLANLLVTLWINLVLHILQHRHIYLVLKGFQLDRSAFSLKFLKFSRVSASAIS